VQGSRVHASPFSVCARFAALLLISSAGATAQTASHAQPTAVAQPPRGPLTQLYQQLGSAGLDGQRVWRIREAHLDRPGLHLTFTEGVIGFTREIALPGGGRTTGAFFSGEGYVLVMPDNRAERAALGLFTGTPTLNEQFTSAFLRFNDATYDDLKPYLRPLEADADEPEETPQGFVERWGGIAASLAEADRLRLLQTFAGGPTGTPDRLLHARLGGTRVGPFDVYYDTLADEPVQVAQVAPTPRGLFLDLWTSFAPVDPGRQVAGGGTAIEPSGGEADSRDPFRISDYKIRAALFPPRELEATTELTLEAIAPAPRLVMLELSRFLHVTTVSQIDANGAIATPLEFIRQEAQRGSKSERISNDVIAVALPAPLQPGQHVRLRFAYAGDVLFQASAGMVVVGSRGIWFPNRGFNQARFDMEFLSPPEWTLVATGGLASSATENGLRVTHWTTPEPRPTAGFNLGEFISAEVKAGEVSISAYINRNFVGPQALPRPEVKDVPMRHNPPQVPPPLPLSLPLPAKARAQSVAEDAAHAVDWMAARLGPFPYRELRLAETPVTSSQGWPGLIFLSTLAFFTPQERARRINDPFLNIMYGHITVAHEIGHEWFGNLVGRKSYRDSWFDEALVNYLALMMFEPESSADFRTALDHYRAELLKKNETGQQTLEAGPVTLGDRLDSSHFPDGYRTIVYGRGTWLIHMLRSMLRDAGTHPAARGAEKKSSAGDEVFFGVLRNLVSQYQQKRMSNADIQRAFEAALPESLRWEGHQSLDWFFDGWVNGTAVPRYELLDVKFSARGGRTVATAKLLQKDAPDDLMTSVPIYAALANGKHVLVGRVFADGEETAIRLDVPEGTRKLLVDPYWTVLRQ
jgi:hypothetical protein